MAASRSDAFVRLLLAVALLLVALGQPAIVHGADSGEEVYEQTARLRGLTPRASVPLYFVEADSLRADLLSSYNDPKAVRETEISRKLLVMLGLLSPDADLHGLLVDLYAENILGYYNRTDKKMYVVSGKSMLASEDKATLAHEFVHALQDQYFDLGRLQEGLEDNSDRSAAVTALIEGDATLAMLLYTRTYLAGQPQTTSGNSGPTSIDQAPLVVRDEVLFPYSEGALFALRLWQTGGFDAINQAFRNPPSSTEQVMHPERYLAREQPIEVTLPDLPAALGPGWSQLRDDVLGELDVRIMIEQFSGPMIGARAAEGWGGDRYAYLENDAGQQALVVSTVWDDESEAGEFYNAYVDVIARRYGNRARRAIEVPSKTLWMTPSGAVLLEKWATHVGLVLAPDQASSEALAAALAGSAAAFPSAPAPVQLPR